MVDQTLQQLLPEVLLIAKSASKQIEEIYRQSGDIEIQIKEDASPITKADKASHQLITAGLSKLTPDWPILSEEGAKLPFSTRRAWQRYWLIDPLDGTKEFIAHSDEFTVNIALIEGNSPILGVVSVPIYQECYWAIAGDRAFWQVKEQTPREIHISECNKTIRATMSRRHGSQNKLDEFINNLNKPVELISCGSTLKICLIARGDADIYPRFGKTSEWDTAAGQCVLEAAGGKLLKIPEGLPLEYNTKESLINPEFIAAGAFDWQPNMMPK